MVLKTTEKVKDKSEINPAGLHKNEHDSIFCKRGHNILLNTGACKETQEIDDVVKVYDDPHSPDSTSDIPPKRSRFLLPGETIEDLQKKVLEEKMKSPEYKAEMLFRKATMLENNYHYSDGVASKFFKEYCQKHLIELMNKNQNATPETLIPQAMTIILPESERLLLIDMKGAHPLKDMIQLGHIARGAVLRSVFTDEGMLSYRVSRNGLTQEVPLNDANWIRYVSILERIHNKDHLRETFDKFIKHRYQDDWLKAQGRFTLGLTDDYINREIRDPLVEKLVTQTVYDTVMDRYLMFPVPDMAAISQVRRGIKNKIYDKDTNTYYGIKDKPYSLWLPYLGILNLMDVYPDTAEADITRLAVEKGLHLGVKDDSHGNITYKEDIGRVIEHDWGFEAYIYAVFKEGELQALSGEELSVKKQRDLIEKTMTLFKKAMGPAGGFLQ